MEEKGIEKEKVSYYVFAINYPVSIRVSRGRRLFVQ